MMKTTPKTEMCNIEGCIITTWKRYWQLLNLTATAQLTLNQKSYELSEPEIKFEMYTALCMLMCEEKTTSLSKYGWLRDSDPYCRTIFLPEGLSFYIYPYCLDLASSVLPDLIQLYIT